MSTKHTQGWWEVRPIAADRVGIMADDVVVASIYCPHAGHTGEADAALIAAAPDLIEALRAVVATEMFLPDHPQRQAAYRNARAAIGKATGGAA